MNYILLFKMPVYLPLAGIFLLIIIFSLLGLRYRKNLVQKSPDEKHETVKIVEGAIFGLLSLLMGFTFSVAITKFEAQRKILVQEATDIKTAVLRCDMYPDSIRNLLRNDLKDYIETRIAYYNAGTDKNYLEAVRRANLISARIWDRTILLSKNPGYTAITAQMVPAVNNMIDVVIARDAERVSHVPSLVLWVLLILLLLAAFMLGVSLTGKRNKILPIISYAFVMSLTLNLIIELNQPGTGLINFDAIQQRIVDLRQLVQ